MLTLSLPVPVNEVDISDPAILTEIITSFASILRKPYAVGDGGEADDGEPQSLMMVAVP